MNKEYIRLIHKNRPLVLERWRQSVLAFFPQRMHSGTPLAEALSDVLAEILDALDESSERVGETVNRVSRILAVQNFPPSKAMSLFFELQAILREIAPGKVKQIHWDEFRTDMEQLTLQAFDSYMVHREKIYQLKVEESKRQTFMMSRRAKA
ncbi:RsbRD N-terminal domain-containing protein [Prosthecochloris sp.]|uniref:RsbRD N-terminal domain-containing protein n=1 Tax=Prosthecochloris sp. TaxID=290513 RepID=UPI0025DFAD2B|nr:RsbRD N-terminal domain-containing protein [Prosthecochloris sp.]